MNYTPNYHLPQWSDTDRVLMTDFNAAMSALETGLTAAQSTADQGQAPIEAAQASADAAQAAAEAAQQTADAAFAKAQAAWSASNPFFVTYSYTGTGDNDGYPVNVGFRPSAVYMSASNGAQYFCVYPATRIGSNTNMIWAATGFTARGNTMSNSYNDSGVQYYFMVFR